MVYGAPTPTPVTGQPIPAGWGDQVTTDLDLLAEFISLYSYGGAMAGSPPASGSATFRIQAGLTTVSFTSGGGTLVFPVPFPGGLLMFMGMIGDATPRVDTLTWDSPFASQISLAATVGGSSPTSNLSISWFALGF